MRTDSGAAAMLSRTGILVMLAGGSLACYHQGMVWDIAKHESHWCLVNFSRIYSTSDYPYFTKRMRLSISIMEEKAYEKRLHAVSADPVMAKALEAHLS